MKPLSPEDFQPLSQSQEHHKIERPSLSYWQDARRRFIKNKRAMASLITILFMIALSIFGPYVWQVSPSEQHLNEALQSPTWSFKGREALIIAEPTPLIKHSPTLIEVVNSSPVKNLQSKGTPSTVAIDFQWEASAGAKAYRIYRNELPPLNIATLGVPLAEQATLDYRDSLKLELIPYYYSVLAIGFDDSETQYATIKVLPQQAFTLAEAKRLGYETQIGEKVRLNSHPLGTDELGRDLLARIIQGGRISLYIGILAPFIYVLIGIIIGGISGYMGGKIDNWIMRFTDFVIALPFLLFMILFKVAAGSSADSINIILFSLIILSWPGTARLVRGQMLQLREEPYVQAAQMLGGRPFYIILRHMLPNTLGIILVTLTFAVPSCIFTEAFLSFIGMGIAPPATSWGAMCSDGVKLMISYPYLLIIPSTFISVIVLAFNILGDGLRDALDAKMRSRE